MTDEEAEAIIRKANGRGAHIEQRLVAYQLRDVRRTIALLVLVIGLLVAALIGGGW